MTTTEANDDAQSRLFTEIYRPRGEPVVDDIKFRIQLLAAFESFFGEPEGISSIDQYLRLSAGIAVPKKGYYMGTTLRFDIWIMDCPLDSLLDGITHIYRYVKSHNQSMAKTWITLVGHALETQNMAYEINEEGGLRYKVDTAFQHSKRMTLACLSGQSFEAAHEELEKAFDYLTQTHPDTKMAAVNIFFAAENVFKLVVGANGNLDEAEAKARLIPLVDRLYSLSDNATKQSSRNIVGSFGKWVNACHPYRHGQQDTTVIAPPQELAIALVTTGTDFIRWLVQLSNMPFNQGNQADGNLPQFGNR